MKLTTAQRRALEAVRDGKVRRTYTSIGSTFQVPRGVSAAIMWKLEANHLVCDAIRIGRASVFSLELTDAGRKVLGTART